MKVVFSTSLLSSASLPLSYLPFRYTVYLSEARKRLVYVGLSLLLAFFCAYTEKVALLYFMTLSLQQTRPRKDEIEKKGVEECIQNVQQDEPSFFGFFCFDKVSWNPTFSKWNDPLQVTQGACANSQEGNAIILSSLPSSTYESGGVQLIFTDVEEAFYTLLSVSLFWCLFACFPVFIYHVWCFVQPGVHVWQSKRARFLLICGVSLVYLVLCVVDEFLLSRVLSFFYSFEIERDSLCLRAETKIVSYVSLYVFVNCTTLLFSSLTVVYRFYKQKEISHSLQAFCFSGKGSLWRRHVRRHLRERGGLSLQYQDQRKKLWWGCLLFSAFISPPEISSQLLCALLLIFLNEMVIWLAYISSCRLSGQMRD